MTSTQASAATTAPAASTSQYKPFKRLLGYMWPRLDMSMRMRIGIAAGLLVLGKSAGLLMPWLLGRLVGVAAEQVGDLFAVMGGLILAYVSAKILSVLFIESKDIVFVGVVQRTIRKLALEVFEHLHRMPLAYHLNRQTGSLALAIERGTKAIELLLVSALFRFMPTFLEILAICVIFWGLYGIEFAAVTLATIVMYTIVTVVVAKWRIRSRRMVNESNETSSTRVLDSLINHETVKLFSAEAREARRYDQALGRYQHASIFSQWTLSALNVSQALVIAAGLGGILLLAAAGAADASEIDAGDLATLNAYLLQMFLPLGFLGTFYRFISEALVDMEKVFALLDTQTTIPDPASGQQLPQGPGEIEFRKVSIALGERPVLRDVSFVVPPAARYALVGQTGSGKTTITRLLGRLLDPDQGAVLIDGCDLREATQLSVREALAYVPQDAVMFNDTLRVNLTFGRPDATDEQILDALATARLDDFIAKLPKGLETQVGERGLKLSGGERQRLAIARALLKQPRIFVLDEATSSLDSETESLVKAAMTAATAGRTTLVIAHRLTTITDCDCILVLEDGRIVEHGRHELLLAGNGVYARFWQMQSRKRETSD